MRTLLVVGGEGNMTGMMADRYPDNMTGLLQALRNCAQYKQIIFFFSEYFLLPPENPEDLLPLAVLDRSKSKDAGKNPSRFGQEILKDATSEALSLFYETMLSFARGRHIVLICGHGNELSRIALPCFASAKEQRLDTQRVEADKLPLLSGIKEWPLVFERLPSPPYHHQLLPDSNKTLSFPWSTGLPVVGLWERCGHVLEAECPVSFPSEDVLGHPRSVLIKGNRGGFLLAIPRPSNMKNFSITLRTGNGLEKEEGSSVVQNKGEAPKVQRNWLTRKEASELIKKSTDTVDNYCRDGKLKASKVGREVRITRESVQRYLNGETDPII